MTNQVTEREAVILSFDTHMERTRTLNVPRPRPLEALTLDVVRQAAAAIVSSDVFDGEVGTGRPVALCRAVHERVTTTKLF